MSIRIACPACRGMLSVREEMAGQRLRCPSCQVMLQIPLAVPTRVSDDGFMERDRPPPRRRALDEPRRGGHRPPPSNAALWWSIAGASAFGVLLLIVVLVVAFGGGNNDQANIGNAGGGQRLEAFAPAPVPVAAPAPIVAGPAGAGEQIYQRLLKSTVWIEANIRGEAAAGGAVPGGVLPGGGLPGGGFGNLPGLPPIPAPPNFGPKFGPKFGPPNFGPKLGPPNMGGPLGAGNLANSVWEGNETLAGYGRLRFEFTSPTHVTMIDARDTVPGVWRMVGNSVTLDFNGAVYDGIVAGNTMRGTARSGNNVWNWTVSKSAGAVPGARPNGGMVASFGSGSLVDVPQRLIVTNVHVVGSADNVRIYFPRFDPKGDVIAQRNAYAGGEFINGRVVCREERADLALVQLERLPADARVVPLSAAKAKPGQQVHSVGNPGASKALWIYSPGKVRQVYSDKWSIPDDITGRMINYNAMKLETDSPINPGDSGGPLVNDQGALVGVAHATDRAAANFSYFIDVSEVRTVLERYYARIGQRWAPAE